MTGTVILGNAKKQALELQDNYFQCIITSPPYFGHRTYSENNSDEIGREDDYLDYPLGKFRDAHFAVLEQRE